LSGIFINYRRDDAPGTAGRLFDHLAKHFSRRRLFMDVAAMKAGLDFVKQLDAQVSTSDVLIAIIGPAWLRSVDDKGQRRLDSDRDYVRIEIASALKRDIPVIPVLVDGTDMPPEDELPEDLKGLTRRHALELRHTRFNADADAIIQALHGALPKGRRKWILPLAAAGLAALCLAGVIFLWPRLSAIFYAGSAPSESATNALKSDPDYQTCDEGSGDQAIVACDRAINSGKFAGHDLAGLYNDRGVERGRKGDPDGAMSDYTEAIKLDAKYALAYKNRGNAHSRKGEYDVAIQDFDRAIQIDPSYALAYAGRGDAYSYKGDVDRAVADYKKALSLHPQEEDRKRIQAGLDWRVCANTSGDQAIIACDGAINSGKFAGHDLAGLYNDRGVHRKEDKNDLDGAISDFSEAIKLDAKYALAYKNRGAAHYEKGEYDAAIQDFDQAVQLAPDYMDAYWWLGDAYRQKGDIDRAVANYKKALSLNPQEEDRKKIQAWLDLTVCDNTSGDQAITACDRAINSGKFAGHDLALLYDARGVHRKEDKNDLDGAISDFSEAIKLDAKYALAYKNRGATHYKKGEYDVAIRDFDQAVQLQPDYWDAYSALGDVYWRKGDIDRAVADYEKALSLNPPEEEWKRIQAVLDGLTAGPAPSPTGGKPAQ
jgi:tetratricopeptide (TPR) repeat protein